MWITLSVRVLNSFKAQNLNNVFMKSRRLREATIQEEGLGFKFSRLLLSPFL